MIEGERRPLPTMCVHDAISAQAARTPGKIAVEHGEESICYRDFEESANRLAMLLNQLGVGQGDLVLLSASTSIPTLIALVAVLKCGAAYVPLDPTYPTARKQVICRQAAAKLVLADAAVDMEAVAGTRVRFLDALAEQARLIHRAPRLPAVDLRALAYVIFTSGSTGAPKGVLTHHMGVANLVAAMAAAWPIDGDSRVLQFASLGFDASVPEWAGPLTVGGAVVLKPAEGLLLGDDLVRFVREKQVTLMKLPASALRVVPPGSLPTLRTVVTAGEACTEELVGTWAPAHRFFNCYGPTEASIGSTMARLDVDSETVTIGRPNPNVSVLVLDENLASPPCGEAGELFIGGLGLSWGYLGRPDLTAERFLPNPHGAPGARMYRTGDLVRQLPSGELQFVGRLDDQVKVRGFRVELGEIEAELLRLNGVRQAAVRVSDDSLTAYVVLARATTDAAAELRSSLRARLPSYMVPGQVVLLNELPLTAHGKIDYSALAAVPHATCVRPKSSVLPTVTSQLVGDVWKEVLGMGEVKPDDHFFELGGHSLAATRIISRLNASLGIELQVRALFESPEFRNFAQVCEQAAAQDGDSQSGVI